MGERLLVVEPAQDGVLVVRGERRHEGERHGGVVRVRMQRARAKAQVVEGPLGEPVVRGELGATRAVVDRLALLLGVAHQREGDLAGGLDQVADHLLGQPGRQHGARDS